VEYINGKKQKLKLISTEIWPDENPKSEMIHWPGNGSLVAGLDHATQQQQTTRQLRQRDRARHAMLVNSCCFTRYELKGFR